MRDLDTNNKENNSANNWSGDIGRTMMVMPFVQRGSAAECAEELGSPIFNELNVFGEDMVSMAFRNSPMPFDESDLNNLVASTQPRMIVQHCASSRARNCEASNGFSRNELEYEANWQDLSRHFLAPPPVYSAIQPRTMTRLDNTIDLVSITSVPIRETSRLDSPPTTEAMLTISAIASQSVPKVQKPRFQRISLHEDQERALVALHSYDDFLYLFAHNYGNHEQWKHVGPGASAIRVVVDTVRVMQHMIDAELKGDHSDTATSRVQSGIHPAINSIIDNLAKGGSGPKKILKRLVLNHAGNPRMLAKMPNENLNTCTTKNAFVGPAVLDTFRLAFKDGNATKESFGLILTSRRVFRNVLKAVKGQDNDGVFVAADGTYKLHHGKMICVYIPNHYGYLLFICMHW
ncbi:hypothetical protein JG688_00008967 [Phytophthora aleatoria]|uniref:Uncharacterized protein n=1 Tax=Phytophthora aleatoria TaxID=2496075 RepID=A0A8J5MG22_9STRA|nr:hypothetical protein JG688_00008967 [Phytophthora aleatoria]